MAEPDVARYREQRSFSQEEREKDGVSGEGEKERPLTNETISDYALT